MSFYDKATIGRGTQICGSNEVVEMMQEGVKKLGLGLGLSLGLNLGASGSSASASFGI